MKTKFKIKKLAIMLAPITIIPVALVACGATASVETKDNKQESNKVTTVAKDKKVIYTLIDNQDAVFAKFDSYVEQANTIFKDLQKKYTPEIVAAENNPKVVKEWKEEVDKQNDYLNSLSDEITDKINIMEQNYKQLPENKKTRFDNEAMGNNVDKWNSIWNKIHPQMLKLQELIYNHLKQLEKQQ